MSPTPKPPSPGAPQPARAAIPSTTKACPALRFNPLFITVPPPSLYCLRKGIEPGREPVQRHGNADSLLGRLEDDEGGLLAGLHLVDQVVLHDDLGDAARRQAAHE